MCARDKCRNRNTFLLGKRFSHPGYLPDNTTGTPNAVLCFVRSWKSEPPSRYTDKYSTALLQPRVEHACPLNIQGGPKNWHILFCTH